MKRQRARGGTPRTKKPFLKLGSSFFQDNGTNTGAFSAGICFTPRRGAFISLGRRGAFDAKGEHDTMSTSLRH